MEKVRLGRTNLIVTKLGWGGIPIQRVGEREAVSVIRAVIEMGVDLLDTARAYTNSEHRIGLALQKIDRPVILSSKSLVKTRARRRIDRSYRHHKPQPQCIGEGGQGRAF
jgi:aryl-alcohol dehydrogenase-like predicted oxidoreductase